MVSQLAADVGRAKADRNAKAEKFAGAMRQGTNAWTQAKTEYGSGNYDAALLQITNALRECETALANGDATAVRPFQTVVSQLAADVRGGKLNDDFKNAANYFALGNYLEALRLCKNNVGNAQFDSLKNGIISEQTTFFLMTNQFAHGDYSFIQSLSIQSFMKKPPFEKLLSGAQPQAEVFKNLEKQVKGSNTWSAVKNILSAPTNASFISKQEFDKFRKWRDNNNPVLQLEGTMILYEVWLGTRDPSRDIIDPEFKKPAKKITTSIPNDQYENAVNSLKNDFANIGEMTSERDLRFKKMIKVIRAWQ